MRVSITYGAVARREELVTIEYLLNQGKGLCRFSAGPETYGTQPGLVRTVLLLKSSDPAMNFGLPLLHRLGLDPPNCRVNFAECSCVISDEESNIDPGLPLVSRTPMNGDNPLSEVFDGKASEIHGGVQA